MEKAGSVALSRLQCEQECSSGDPPAIGGRTEIPEQAGPFCWPGLLGHPKDSRSLGPSACREQEESQHAKGLCSGLSVLRLTEKAKLSAILSGR